MMHDDSPEVTERPGLEPCRCLSHPPIIVRPQCDQLLNQTIRQLLGIQKKTVFSEPISDSVAVQNTICASIDRTKTVILDQSNSALYHPEKLRSVNRFSNSRNPQALSPIRNDNRQCIGNTGEPAVSKQIINQELDFSEIFPEGNFNLSQTEIVVKKEQSQDEFADLWADFDSLPAVIPTNSSIQCSPNSDHRVLPLNAPALTNISSCNNESACLPRNSPISASSELNGIKPKSYEHQHSCNVIRRSSTETIANHSTIPNTGAFLCSQAISNMDGIEVTSRPSPYQFGFSTASGKMIDISSEMLRKGEELLKEDIPDEAGFAISPGNSNQISSDMMHKEQSIIFNSTQGKVDIGSPGLDADIHPTVKRRPANVECSSASFSFATASGKKIEFTSEMLQKGEELLKEVNSEISKVEPQTASLGFAVASPTTSEFTSGMLQKEEDQEEIFMDHSIASFSFATAFGKRVNLTSEMLRKGEELLKEHTVMPITPSKVDSAFDFSTGSGCPVAVTKEMMSKGTVILNKGNDPTPSQNSECKVIPATSSSNPINASNTQNRNPKDSRPERHFGNDLTNAQGNPLALTVPRVSRPRQMVSTCKRIREKPSTVVVFKTPSPITKVSTSLAAVNLQTPPSQTGPYRKRLKFTPPACRTPSSINNVSIPSPRKLSNNATPCSFVTSNLPKMSLKEFGVRVSDLKKSGNMLGYFPSIDIVCMTSALSTSYQFSDGKTWRTVCDDLTKAGVSTVWISEKWVKNHYRWVVWKLASIERRLDIPCLQYDHVFKRIYRRYQQEFISSRRSCLKIITERDNAPCRFLILCVAFVDYEAKLIELTDGWYSILAELDAGLKKVLAEGKLYEGLKLRLYNCSLVGDLSPCTPLENTSMRLRLSINSTRRAPCNARLGYQQKGPFLVSLSSLKPNGGAVPKLRLKILRVMPTQYTEKVLTSSGRPSKVITRVAVRNQIGEVVASKAHEEQMNILQDILQDRLSEKSVECLLVRIRSSKLISVELAEKITNEIQDVSFERVTDILKEQIYMRPVTMIHRYLVESAAIESNPLPRTYLLNISVANIQKFRVGDVITAIQLDCNSGPYGSLTLSSTNRSQITAGKLQSCSSSEPFTLDFSCHDLSMGLFFDVSGLLVLRTSTSIVICSATDHPELVVVQLGADWLSPNIAVGQFIRIENLFYNRFDSRLSCHSTVGRGTASICADKTSIPVPVHFGLQCRRASAIVDPINHPVRQHFCEARSISKLLIGSVDLQSESESDQDFVVLSLNSSSILAKKELLSQLPGVQKDALSLTGRHMYIWISAEIDSQNLLIAEAIELS